MTNQGKVVYLAEKRTCRRFPKPNGETVFPGVPRNFQVFDPLDFLAELTQHIYGFYSNKARGLRAKAAPGGTCQTDPRQTPGARTARRRWATLIKHVWQVDPLTCPRCHGRLKIISLIQPTQPDVIKKILKHCGLWQQPSRAPPSSRDAQGHQGRELTYVSDLEYVDAAPPETVWSAD